jgi:Flp pilus assembly protein TadB
MLNQNDRRRLAEIERELQREDPAFARRFSQWPPPRPRMRVAPALVLVVGALVMVLSLLALLPAVFLLTLAATVGGYLWLRRRDRRGAGPADELAA